LSAVRGAMFTLPALVAACVAGSLATAPMAEATEGHSCSGAYVQYESPGDHVYARDTRKDGRTVFINLYGPGNYNTTFWLSKGAGSSYRWNINLKEHRTVKLYVSLVKGNPWSDSSKWKRCTKFKTHT